MRIGSNPADTSPEAVGGKGYNQLVAAWEGYNVPNGEIIPVGVYPNRKELLRIYNEYKRPIIVRSSSVVEDGKRFAFPGVFDSDMHNSYFQLHFLPSIDRVRASARGKKALEYAKRHGIDIPEEMALIVQEQMEFDLAGVCYSSAKQGSKETFIEYLFLRHSESVRSIMNGRKQANIAAFDESLDLFWHYQYDPRDVYEELLKEVAKVSRSLEEKVGYRVDMEFGILHNDSFNPEIYVIQFRPITEPHWPEVVIPEIEEDRVITDAIAVRGAGEFEGPAYPYFNPDPQVAGFSSRSESNDFSNLQSFNKAHPHGYCLVTFTLNKYSYMLNAVNNAKAVVTLEYASRYSHPASLIAETGAFYLGTVGKGALFYDIKPGDNIKVIADQMNGYVYDHEKLE